MRSSNHSLTQPKYTASICVVLKSVSLSIVLLENYNLAFNRSTTSEEGKFAGKFEHFLPLMI